MWHARRRLSPILHCYAKPLRKRCGIELIAYDVVSAYFVRSPIA